MTRELLKFAPYPNYGTLFHETEGMYQLMLPIHRDGWQIATHAHGERAIDQVLGVYERLLAAHPRIGHRHRLEHCGLITQEQLVRANDLGVSLSFFVDHVYYFGEALRDNILGPERGGRYMPLGSATRGGHKWTVHSDSPVVPLNPLRTLQTAVTRVMRGTTEVLAPDQRVEVVDGLKAYTVHGAEQIHHGHLLGSLEAGKLADFTVLDRNPLSVPAGEIRDIEVVATYRYGNKVNV